MSNVTVIADAKLGGIGREYTEVKRKANVGERVKVVNAYCTFGDYDNGDIFIVGKLYCDRGFTPTSADENFGYIHDKEYVVLEPTDIVHIDGVRYRMVERKANVGERVMVTSVVSGYFYSVGDVGIATSEMRVNFNDCGNKRVVEGGRWAINHVGNPADRNQYRVLEPVAASAGAPAPSQPDIQRTVDGLTETVANLARRLSEAERKLTALEPKEIADALSSYVTRDSVIEQAKRDVAELEKRAYSKMDTPSTIGVGHLKFKFVVNRDKRTVAAIGHLRYCESQVSKRGIAKCSPDDVFNVHIGKAIALRRALGLEIPVKYVKAPQPTEIRIGDVVRSENKRSLGAMSNGRSGPVTSIGAKSLKNRTFIDFEKGITFSDAGFDWWAYADSVVIIDDSRTEEREEVTAA